MFEFRDTINIFMRGAQTSVTWMTWSLVPWKSLSAVTHCIDVNVLMNVGFLLGDFLNLMQYVPNQYHCLYNIEKQQLLVLLLKDSFYIKKNSFYQSKILILD